MNMLEQNFVSAIEELDLPEGDLVDSVLAALDPSVVVPFRRYRPTLKVALVAAAVVILALLAVPASRHAVAGLLGIGATEISMDSRSEDSRSQPSPGQPTVTIRESAEDLGELVDDVSAIDALPLLEMPDGVFDHPIRGRSFTWDASDELPALGDTVVGAVLSVRPVESFTSRKSVPFEVGVEAVVIDPAQAIVGYWLDGEHELATGGSDQPVLAQRVLLWVVEGFEFRLEVDVGREQAIALAKSVGEGTDLSPPG